MSRQRVPVKFSHEGEGTEVTYYRTVPSGQLVCMQDGSWMAAVDDGVWEEPTSAINEEQFDLHIITDLTTLDVCCEHLGDVFNKISEVQKHFINSMDAEERDSLCSALSAKQSEIFDIKTVAWFMSTRNDLLGLVIKSATV